jgi:hypothetical protein
LDSQQKRKFENNAVFLKPKSTSIKKILEMNSIFNSDDNLQLQKRIQQLSPTSKALWGTMNVAQMLSHCQAPLDLTFGTLIIKSNFIMRIVGKLFKNKVLQGRSFKKNSPTVKEFIRAEHVSFDEAKKTLLESLNFVLTEGEKAIKVKKHPFLGALTTEEWDALQYKHLNHHLKQFGV